MSGLRVLEGIMEAMAGVMYAGLGDTGRPNVPFIEGGRICGCYRNSSTVWKKNSPL